MIYQKHIGHGARHMMLSRCTEKEVRWKLSKWDLEPIVTNGSFKRGSALRSNGQAI